MAIELDNRTKILAGVVVLAAVGAGAWFFFLEEFLAEPPPKAPAAKSAPAGAPKQADAAKPAADAPKPAATAAAPAPGAKPIPTNPDRLIAEVIERSGVLDYFQTTGRETTVMVAVSLDALNTGTIGAADFRAMVDVANRVFEPAKMTAEIAANLKGGNLDAERMGRFLELLRQPIVAKMTAPEMRSISPEAIAEMHAATMREGRTSLAARTNLFKALDNVTRTLDVGVDMAGALARDMVDTFLESMKKQSKNVPAEARQKVGAQLNAIRDTSRTHILGLAMVMYRKASDEELSEYVKLLDTDTGRWGSEQLAIAIRPVLVARASAIGREVAQLAIAKLAAGKKSTAPQAKAQKEENPADKPAATPVAALVEAPAYQRPANIREAYSRYNDVISATVMRDRAAVKELLDDGKNPDARQRDGLTPLMIAASNGDVEIATMLLAKGAEPNQRASGRSALSIAKSRGSSGAAMVQLLQRSGAKE